MRSSYTYFLNWPFIKDSEAVSSSSLQHSNNWVNRIMRMDNARIAMQCEFVNAAIIDKSICDDDVNNIIMKIKGAVKIYNTYNIPTTVRTSLRIRPTDP